MTGRWVPEYENGVPVRMRWYVKAEGPEVPLPHWCRMPFCEDDAYGTAEFCFRHMPGEGR